MVSLLVSLLLLVLIFGILYYVITLLPLPEPFGKIALLILLLVFVIILASWLLGGVGRFPIMLR